MGSVSPLHQTGGHCWKRTRSQDTWWRRNSFLSIQVRIKWMNQNNYIKFSQNCHPWTRSWQQKVGFLHPKWSLLGPSIAAVVPCGRYSGHLWILEISLHLIHDHCLHLESSRCCGSEIWSQYSENWRGNGLLPSQVDFNIKKTFNLLSSYPAQG